MIVCRSRARPRREHRTTLHSSVAQWQSIRLLTGGLLVRVQPEEPLTRSSISLVVLGLALGFARLASLVVLGTSPARGANFLTVRLSKFMVATATLVRHMGAAMRQARERIDDLIERSERLSEVFEGWLAQRQTR